eukprot:610644-Pyramimonas_sp.AAC.1
MAQPVAQPSLLPSPSFRRRNLCRNQWGNLWFMAQAQSISQSMRRVGRRFVASVTVASLWAPLEAPRNWGSVFV